MLKFRELGLTDLWSQLEAHFATDLAHARPTKGFSIFQFTPSLTRSYYYYGKTIWRQMTTGARTRDTDTSVEPWREPKPLNIRVR